MSNRTNNSATAALIGMWLVAALAGAPDVRASAYSAAVMADNPTAYWRLNETSGTTAFDATAPAENGVYIPTVTLGAPGSPMRGEPGNTGMGDTASGLMQAYTVPIGASFTVALWAKSATPTWNGYGMLLSSRQANGFILHPQAGSKALNFYAYNSSGGISGVGGPNPTFDITQWHHYAAAYDSVASTFAFYLDGQLAASGPFSVARTAGTLNVDVGHDNGNYFNGTLDEVAIYDYALSASQIAYQYAAAVPEPSMAGLLLVGLGAWWLRRRNVRTLKR